MEKNFDRRHIGVNQEQIKQMLHSTKANSLDELMERIVPDEIKINTDSFKLDSPLTEFEVLQHMKELSEENKIYKSYIGLGYNFSIMPSVIKRNILENPNWYTAYTPYQSEISQGRLNAVFNFQSMITDLTQMNIANASLLDESTAIAEAMIMLYNTQNLRNNNQKSNSLFVSDGIFPQNLAVIKTRAKALDIKVVVGNIKEFDLENTQIFAAIFQMPTKYGSIETINKLEEMKKMGIGIAIAADIMSLVLLEPPKVDVIVGSTQRFGLPMGYGGPHSAFFATLDKYKRHIPGRIIGLSKDRLNNDAFRMALQTREQHIRKEKATSNICTSQVLLAVISSMYAIYHGKKGILKIANNIHNNAKKLSELLQKLGLTQLNKTYFDTLKIKINAKLCSMNEIKLNAETKKVNLLYIDKHHISISINEATNQYDIIELAQILTKQPQKTIENELNNINEVIPAINIDLKRKSAFLSDTVFNSYHSETKMMRYIRMLEKKDITLTHSMIPLGSCTMKLNAATQLYPISDPLWSDIHPFAPIEQAKGYKKVFEKLENYLCKITGFECCSLQPNSGAQGEYLGLLLIKEYFADKGENNRNIVLIPSSAHGTNPASATMAGMKVVIVKCNEKGNIDLNDIKEKIELHNKNIAALMVTYPSTHGVFERDINKINSSIHSIGGLVYMDGANMNAQIGLTNPSKIGADVCHLNLHKTFAIPHGGGGPGMGPICAVNKLKKFMPSHPIIKDTNLSSQTIVSSAPWGSALITLISYSYIRLLSDRGLTNCSKIAILNANYLKSKLSEHFTILYTGPNKNIAHEFIIDCREFKSKNVDVIDIAKRLIDYGFHAPTVSFPVNGTLMIEPTESEDKEELDRFCQSMISIKNEINLIGKSYDNDNNPIKNAPHSLEWLIQNKDNISYSLETALYPLEWIKQNKFLPPVSRINDAYGDRNLICSCNTDDYK